MVGDMHEMQSTLDEMRDHLADFDDFARPFRSYLYWEQHCFDIPVCSAARSVFEATDGVDKFSENMSTLINDMHNIDAILPQMLAEFPPDHRGRKVHAGRLAHHAQQLLWPRHANGPDDRHRQRDGPGLRRIQEWRLLLFTAGSVPKCWTFSGD